MDFAIPAGTRKKIELTRELGQEWLRPLGIEADRLARPVPPDHPFFYHLLKLGLGRTRWSGKGRELRQSESGLLPSSAVEGVLLAEEASYWDRGVSTSRPGPNLGEPSMLTMATDEQRERFLTRFLEPEKPIWGSFAMTEPGAGSDVARIRTRAVKDGKDWVLTGEKMYAANSGRAEWITVFATIDPALGRAGHRAFVVEHGMPGLGPFKPEKKMGLKGYESTSFALNEVRVPAENLLGGEGYYKEKAGFKGAMSTFNATRPAVAALATGIGRAALDESIAFAKANGLLGDVRIRDRIERIKRKLQMARLLALRAAWLADRRQPNTVEASMSKAVAPPIAFDAASLGMELLGTVGARGDHLIEKLFRDIKAMDIVEGTGQIQRVIMARKLVGLPSS